jgi:hypothetical protein
MMLQCPHCGHEGDEGAGNDRMAVICNECGQWSTLENRRLRPQTMQERAEVAIAFGEFLKRGNPN